jgi:hypothetical protein
VTSPSGAALGSVASDSYAIGDKPTEPSNDDQASASTNPPRSTISAPDHVYPRGHRYEDGSSSIHIEIPTIGRPSHSTDECSPEPATPPSIGGRGRHVRGTTSSSMPPSVALEPEQAFIETTTRLVKRSETAESVAIFGGSNVYIEPGGLSAEVSVMSERTRITSRNDGGREYERVYLQSRCSCPEGEEHVCGQSGLVDGSPTHSSFQDLVMPYTYAETEEADESHESQAGWPKPFLPVVEDALIQARVLSAIGSNNWFIPCTELVRIMRKEIITKVLPECATGRECPYSLVPVP